MKIKPKDIRLRPVKLSDAKELWNLINDKEVIKQLSGYSYPCPFSKIKKETEEGIRNLRTKKSYYFTILANGEIVGWIVLENPSKDKKRYDIGFYIGRKFWNKGIASEAIRQTIDFGFNKLKLYRIQADNDSDNPASGRAMKKAGMKFEGARKNIQKKGNKFIDLHLWGIWR